MQLRKNLFEGTMVPYILMFPVEGERECEVVWEPRREDLPLVTVFAFIELYCIEAACDCGRVMINVMGDEWEHLATINYGLREADEMRGPFLDPLNQQSQYSKALLKIWKRCLKNPTYVQRLEKHYERVKKMVRDKSLRYYPKIAGPLHEEMLKHLGEDDQ